MNSKTTNFGNWLDYSRTLILSNVDFILTGENETAKIGYITYADEAVFTNINVYSLLNKFLHVRKVVHYTLRYATGWSNLFGLVGNAAILSFVIL